MTAAFSEYVSRDKTLKERMVSDIEKCTAGRKNTYCYTADAAEAEQAHKAGLSCGKYRAFLQAREVCPDITEEDARGMTMRELHDIINGGACENMQEAEDTDCGGKHRHGKNHGNHENNCPQSE